MINKRIRRKKQAVTPFFSCESNAFLIPYWDGLTDSSEKYLLMIEKAIFHGEQMRHGGEEMKLLYSD